MRFCIFRTWKLSLQIFLEKVLLHNSIDIESRQEHNFGIVSRFSKPFRFSTN